MATNQGMSSEAVKSKTGRTWQEWERALDRDGADKMSHAELARRIAEKYALSGWWSQTVAVAYERAKGKRAVNQKSTGGFAVSVSKTIPASIKKLYAAWTDARTRAKWLGESPTFSTKNQNKSLRMKWIDESSRVSVEFRAKDRGKSTVVVQHEDLSGKEEVETKRSYWKAALGRLEETVIAD